MHLKDFFYFKWGLPLGVVDIIGLHAMNYVTDSHCTKLYFFVPRACFAHMAVFPRAVFACNYNQDLHKEEWDIFAVLK